MAKPPFPNLPPLPKAFADLQEKVTELVRSSPAADVEKHMKATLSSALGRMDVVTREDFEIQTQMLSKALEKMAVLERRVAELEASAKPKV